MEKIEDIQLDLVFEIKGNDAEEVTEKDVLDFIRFQLIGGSLSNDNPLINEDTDCEIDWIYD